MAKKGGGMVVVIVIVCVILIIAGIGFAATSGGDKPCGENKHVKNGKCVPCPRGDVRPAGDLIEDGNTTCNPPQCKESLCTGGKVVISGKSGRTESECCKDPVCDPNICSDGTTVIKGKYGVTEEDCCYAPDCKASLCKDGLVLIDGATGTTKSHCCELPMCSPSLCTGGLELMPGMKGTTPDECCQTPRCKQSVCPTETHILLSENEGTTISECCEEKPICIADVCSEGYTLKDGDNYGDTNRECCRAKKCNETYTTNDRCGEGWEIDNTQGDTVSQSQTLCCKQKTCVQNGWSNKCPRQTPPMSLNQQDGLIGNAADICCEQPPCSARWTDQECSSSGGTWMGFPNSSTAVSGNIYGNSYELCCNERTCGTYLSSNPCPPEKKSQPSSTPGVNEEHCCVLKTCGERASEYNCTGTEQLLSSHIPTGQDIRSECCSSQTCTEFYDENDNNVCDIEGWTKRKSSSSNNLTPPTSNNCCESTTCGEFADSTWRSENLPTGNPQPPAECGTGTVVDESKNNTTFPFNRVSNSSMTNSDRTSKVELYTEVCCKDKICSAHQSDGALCTGNKVYDPSKGNTQTPEMYFQRDCCMSMNCGELNGKGMTCEDTEVYVPEMSSDHVPTDQVRTGNKLPSSCCKTSCRGHGVYAANNNICSNRGADFKPDHTPQTNGEPIYDLLTTDPANDCCKEFPKGEISQHWGTLGGGIDSCTLNFYSSSNCTGTPIKTQTATGNAQNWSGIYPAATNNARENTYDLLGGATGVQISGNENSLTTSGNCGRITLAEDAGWESSAHKHLLGAHNVSNPNHYDADTWQKGAGHTSPTSDSDSGYAIMDADVGNVFGKCHHFGSNSDLKNDIEAYAFEASNATTKGETNSWAVVSDDGHCPSSWEHIDDPQTCINAMKELQSTVRSQNPRFNNVKFHDNPSRKVKDASVGTDGLYSLPSGYVSNATNSFPRGCWWYEPDGANTLRFNPDKRATRNAHLTKGGNTGSGTGGRLWRKRRAICAKSPSG